MFISTFGSVSLKVNQDECLLLDALATFKCQVQAAVQHCTKNLFCIPNCICSTALLKGCLHRELESRLSSLCLKPWSSVLPKSISATLQQVQHEMRLVFQEPILWSQAALEDTEKKSEISWLQFVQCCLLDQLLLWHSEHAVQLTGTIRIFKVHKCAQELRSTFKIHSINLSMKDEMKMLLVHHSK